MAEAASWQAPGRARVSTFVVCPEADRVIDFAKAVFGARALSRPLRRSDGSLWNAELAIGDSTIMIGAATGDMVRPAFLYVQVPDAHATLASAVAHGAREVMPIARRFYGADDGGVEDMGGNLWWISTHREDLTDDQIAAATREEEARR